MRLLNFSTPKVVAALAAAAVLSVPALALAQPSDQTYGQPPSYALPAHPNEPSITGTVSGFDGQWIVYMHDDKGYTDHITLHQGTVINPTGIRLNEGMKVTVYGSAAGSTFQANRIDVAYSPYSPYYSAGSGQPVGGYGDFYGYGGGYGGYGGYGYGGGYGGYGYPGYGYGGYGGYPYFGIGINWGWGWGWGWPGFWGWWGWPSYGFGFYGGYPYYGYGGYPYRYGCCGFRGGSGFVPGRRGTIGVPVSGRMQGGGMRAPVSGGMSGGMRGGGGGMHGGPPR